MNNITAPQVIKPKIIVKQELAIVDPIPWECHILTPVQQIINACSDIRIFKSIDPLIMIVSD